MKTVEYSHITATATHPFISLTQQEKGEKTELKGTTQSQFQRAV